MRCIRTPPVGLCVCKIDIKYMHKNVSTHNVLRYLVVAYIHEAVHAKISTNLIQGYNKSYMVRDSFFAHDPSLT